MIWVHNSNEKGSHNHRQPQNMCVTIKAASNLIPAASSHPLLRHPAVVQYRTNWGIDLEGIPTAKQADKWGAAGFLNSSNNSNDRRVGKERYVNTGWMKYCKIHIAPRRCESKWNFVLSVQVYSLPPGGKWETNPFHQIKWKHMLLLGAAAAESRRTGWCCLLHLLPPLVTSPFEIYVLIRSMSVWKWEAGSSTRGHKRVAGG